MPVERLYFAPWQYQNALLRIWLLLGPEGPLGIGFKPQMLEPGAQWLRNAGYQCLEAAPEAWCERARRRVEESLSGIKGNAAPCSPLLDRGSPFQQAVWREISLIPGGQVISYAQLTTRLGNKNLARAVGAACGANPLPLLIPCHRVVAVRGMGGYAGGVDLKSRLLDLEGASLPH